MTHVLRACLRSLFPSRARKEAAIIRRRTAPRSRRTPTYTGTGLGAARFTDMPSHIRSQTTVTPFKDTHPEASDPAGAVGIHRTRPRTESPLAETYPHIEITPRVIGEAISVQRSGESLQPSALSRQQSAGTQEAWPIRRLQAAIRNRGRSPKGKTTKPRVSSAAAPRNATLGPVPSRGTQPCKGCTALHCGTLTGFVFLGLPVTQGALRDPGLDCATPSA